MIEHRLYSVERWQGLLPYERYERIILMTPQEATYMRLQGYDVFDFHESLDMEPEQYEKVIKHELF